MKSLPWLQFRDVFGIEPKTSAWAFMKANNCAPEHGCSYLKEATDHFLTQEDLHCSLHSGKCSPPGLGNILVCGFPCSPFSSQRSQRYQSSTGSEHSPPMPPLGKAEPKLNLRSGRSSCFSIACVIALPLGKLVFPNISRQSKGRDNIQSIACSASCAKGGPLTSMRACRISACCKIAACYL